MLGSCNQAQTAPEMCRSYRKCLERSSFSDWAESLWSACQGMLWIKFDFAEINVYSLKQTAVSYFLLEVLMEYSINGTMFVFIFFGGIRLENWSDNSHMIKILHQLSSVIQKTTILLTLQLKNNENSHSFIKLSPPTKVGMDKQIKFQLRYVCIIFWGTRGLEIIH